MTEEDDTEGIGLGSTHQTPVQMIAPTPNSIGSHGTYDSLLRGGCIRNAALVVAISSRQQVQLACEQRFSLQCVYCV